MPDQTRLAGPEGLKDAVQTLKQGGLVAFPTETVYGLGADARNPVAVNKIFKAKQRPANHPLIVHLAGAEQMLQWAENIPALAWRLAEKYWPGPLAMILPRHPDVPLEVTGGQPTVALRIPDNSLALELLRQFGDGIAAPSANRFNHVSPTRAEHVLAELGDSIDLILDGGDCTVGLESTIVDLTQERPVILRPGHITPEQLSQFIGQPVDWIKAMAANQNRAPGTMALHYAPDTACQLVYSEDLLEWIGRGLEENKRMGVLAWQQHCPVRPKQLVERVLPDDPVAYGHDLYAALRWLDQQHLDQILVEAVPDEDAWLAVKDRLSKATAARK
jgi:L-threonylcarbamoyladenylate synthase